MQSDPKSAFRLVESILFLSKLLQNTKQFRQLRDVGMPSLLKLQNGFLIYREQPSMADVYDLGFAWTCSTSLSKNLWFAAKTVHLGLDDPEAHAW